MRSWEQEIRQDSEQKRTDMSQKERPHQGDTERIESQAPGYEVVQNWETGKLSAASYGHAAMGMCPSSIQHKRTTAADSCGKRIKTACATTILHFHVGENGDPAIWFPLVQLRTWLELQGEEMEHRLGKIDVARAWAAASANMKKKSRWSMVKGPMTATMTTLHDLSIIPASPWKWYPAENPDVEWTYSGGDTGPFINEMQQRLSHKVWEQAALHYHGLGAENGVNMGSTQTPQTVARTWRTCQSWYVIQDRHGTNLRWPIG